MNESDYRSETAKDIKVEIYTVNGSDITKYYDANEQTQHSIRLDIPDSQGNIFIVKIINKTKVITRKVTL